MPSGAGGCTIFNALCKKVPFTHGLEPLGFAVTFDPPFLNTFRPNASPRSELSWSVCAPGFRTLCATVLRLYLVLRADGGELKVDINRDTKNLDSVTEVGYTKWSADTTGGATTGTAAATKTFTSATGETVIISFSQTALSQGRGGTGLMSNWYQTGAQGTAKLVSDGFTVAPATLSTGGQIQMTITGLEPGHHTLLTYHNHWDALTSGSLGPIDIYLNGVMAVDNLQPTIRAATNSAAPIAYLEFDVTSTADITTILFAAETDTTAAIKNPMINGFEFDTPNSTRIVHTPSPADGDEHVDADAGSANLSWQPATAGSAVSHDVYLGTSLNTVKNATRASPEFKGNQTATTYAASGLNSMSGYYWRIDEIDALGNVTKGVVWYFRPRHLAFPGAEGYGRFARGGRGGAVVEVTNLNDRGPGSLRDALTETLGPRTVVFTVSGLITLNSDLTINQPYITVAGQTAPGKGICVRRFPLGMSGGKDVIIRHIRSRPGNISGTTLNGSGIAGSDHCIMDHCSISWGIDEEMSTRTSKNVTLQRTLISEALNIAGHQNYPPGTAHGYAASIGGDVGSFHHNLLAHCAGRNWSMAGGLDAAGFFAGRLDIFNNVVYNWDNRTTDGGAREVNFVNNFYKPGAASRYFYALNANYGNFPGTQQYYFAGNLMPGYFDETNQAAGRTASGENGGSVPTTYSPWVAAPFFPSYATLHPVRDAFRIVLSDVGCNQPLIDDHDARVIKEALNGTYAYSGSVSGKPGLPDSQNDVGGWENYGEDSRPTNWDTDHDGLPNWWETLFGSNPNSAANDFTDSNADLDGDGYTALEDYLNWLAAPYVATTPSASLNIDLAPFAAGFVSPVYNVSGAQGGTVALHANGHTAIFTPVSGFTGLASFDFTIGGGGTSITRAVGVCVSVDAIFERRWRGGAAGNTWDLSSENWLNGSTRSAFQPGNPVVFDEVGFANGTVTINGAVQPSSVKVMGAADYTFTGSGTLSGSMSLTKSGSGVLTLNGTHSYTGVTTVQGGTLALNGTLGGSAIRVESGGTLSGTGSITGSIAVDAGGLVSIGASAFAVNGNVTNDGTIRLTGGAAFNVSGAFVNNGVLDIMTGSQALPSGFVNNGVVLDSSLVRAKTAEKAGTSFTVTIQGYAGHSYQLQRTETLSGPWTSIGPPQAGNGGMLTFIDSGGATGDRKFYRVAVAP